MLGQSIAVLDEQFVRLFGQLTEAGGISALTYARRLNMLPVGVIAQTAGVAAYPYLARLVEEGKLREMAATVTRTIRYTIFISAPAVAAILALSQPAVRVVYERGEFGPQDTVLTATAPGLLRAFDSRLGRPPDLLPGVLRPPPDVDTGRHRNRRNGCRYRSVLVVEPLRRARVRRGQHPRHGSLHRCTGMAWHAAGRPRGCLRDCRRSLARSALGGGVAAPIAWLVVKWISGGELPGFWGSLGLVAIGAAIVLAVYVARSRLLGSPELAELRTAERSSGQR